MAGLFDDQPPAPRVQPPRRASDPRVHVCDRCGREGAPCGMHGHWYCVPCAPADYWPGRR